MKISVFKAVEKKEGPEKEIILKLMLGPYGNDSELRVVDEEGFWKQSLLYVDENGVRLPRLNQEYQEIFKTDDKGRLKVNYE